MENLNLPSLSTEISRFNQYVPSLPQLPQNTDHQLIVIGNGFDINCGLPSRFSDFFKDRIGALGEAAGLGGEDLVDFCKKRGLTVWDLILATRHAIPCGYMEANWCDVESAIATVILGSSPELDEEIGYDAKLVTSYSIEECLGGVADSPFDAAAEAYEGMGMEAEEVYDVVFAGMGGYITPLEEFGTDTARVASYLVAAYSSDEWDREAVLKALLSELHLLEKSFASHMLSVVEESATYQERASKLLGKLIRYDLDEDSDSASATTVLDFNYTTPDVPIIEESTVSDFVNIHGEASGDVVIGIDGKDLMDDPGSIQFTKTYRLLGLRAKGLHCPIAFKSDSIAKLGVTETWAIKFYGHSLAAADYSYFQSIFDMVDLYDSDVKLYFFFSNYEDGVEEREFLKVTGLLSAYGETMDNRDHGKNLTHKLLLEGRLAIIAI